MSDIAIVTGANRGIGLEVCRQLADLNYTVILGSRDETKGEHAAAQLNTKQVIPHQLDVSDPDSIERLRAWVTSEFGVLDVLVNNAGILYDTWQRASEADLAVVQQAIDTNTFGPWRMAQAFIPLLRQSQYGRIVNVSSEAGSLTSMGGGTPAYSFSKAALNAVTRLLAGELRSDRILVNSICPGWVATDMGGASAPRSPAEGARAIVWAATLPDGGPTGGFFRDERALPW